MNELLNGTNIFGKVNKKVDFFKKVKNIYYKKVRY